MIMPKITLIEMSDGTCKIKADSTESGGDVKYLHVNASQYDMLNGMLEYKKGKLIQSCFPFLSADEREFILSGLTPDEYERLFPSEDKEKSTHMGSTS